MFWLAAYFFLKKNGLEDEIKWHLWYPVSLFSQIFNLELVLPVEDAEWGSDTNPFSVYMDVAQHISGEMVIL